MAEFEPAINITLKNEGGYVNNPNDPGGETNFGIAKRDYPNIDIKNLTIDQAKNIYFHDYWKFGGIIDQEVANKLFDMYVNMEHAAIKIIQKIVNLPEDGFYGPNTEKAINNTVTLISSAALLTTYKNAIVGHYEALIAANPKLKIFEYGWLRRAME